MVLFFSDKNEELKYKFVLIELFSADCFHIFVTFIQVSLSCPFQFIITFLICCSETLQ